MRYSLILLLIAAAPAAPRAKVIYTVTTTADSGPNSLRQAILDSNASVGILDTIKFDITAAPPNRIMPLSALPDITDPVVIDATTEPDYAGSPVIELDGSLAVGYGFNVI